MHQTAEIHIEFHDLNASVLLPLAVLTLTGLLTLGASVGHCDRSELRTPDSLLLHDYPSNLLETSNSNGAYTVNSSQAGH